MIQHLQHCTTISKTLTLYRLYFIFKQITPKNSRNPGGMGGIYPPNNLTASLPINWVWSTCASPQSFDSGLHLSAVLHLNSGGKSLPSLAKTFFFSFSFGLHLNLGKTVFQFWWKPFFWGSSLNLLTWKNKKNRGRCSSPPMLKIGQNWGKIPNYPPNAQQRSAPLPMRCIMKSFKICR